MAPTRKKEGCSEQCRANLRPGMQRAAQRATVAAESGSERHAHRGHAALVGFPFYYPAKCAHEQAALGPPASVEKASEKG